MAKYVYPAIFTPEENGMFSINFPDVKNAYTCGDNLVDGIEMAEDVLALSLYEYERDKVPVPTPSELQSIKLNGKEFVNYISCDTIFYQRKHNNKAVKKTLSIPDWLNEAALEANINFSQVLQEALVQKLDIS